MKNHFTFATLFLFLSLAAQAYPAELVLRMFDNSTFTVVFDGQRYNNVGNPFQLKGIIRGQHYLRVIRFSPYDGRRVTVFRGYISLPENTRIFAVIDRYYQYRIERQDPLFVEERYHNNRNYNRNNNQRQNYNQDYNSQQPYQDYRQPADNQQNYDNNDYDDSYYNNQPDSNQQPNNQQPKYNQQNNNQQNNNQPNYNQRNQNQPNQNNNNNLQPLTDAEFGRLMLSMKKASFSNEKANLALTVMQSAWLTSGQVADLVKTIQFDSDKLTVAKAGYDKVTDRKNFYIVLESFAFSSTRQEMTEYMRNR